MPHRIRLAAVPPVLLALAAVFFCAFGFAVHADAAGSGPERTHVAAPVAAQAGHTGHSEAASPVQAASPAHPLDGHDGHTGEGDHAVHCMPGASTSPVAVVTPAAREAATVVIADPAVPRFAALSGSTPVPHPPDLRSLCVQRV
ncbi:MAG: hypothetical protein ACT4QG_07995 [Sporichthyaceae bacterium]